MRVSMIQYIQGRNFSPGRDADKTGIAIHNTSNPGASAADEAAYAARRTDNVSAHFYVDGTEVIQSLDTSVIAWHSASTLGNLHGIAIEIRGVNGWTRAQWLNGVAWDALGKVLAALCVKYSIPLIHLTPAQMKSNPSTRGFYGHDDMRRAWGVTTHTDPGPNFPWDRLLGAVRDSMNGDDVPDTKTLLAADVVPNRAWRTDVKTNPTVTWSFAVTDTWDRAYQASQMALAAKTAALAAQAAVAEVAIAVRALPRSTTAVLSDEQMTGLSQAVTAAIAPTIAKTIADEMARRLRE